MTELRRCRRSQHCVGRDLALVVDSECVSIRRKASEACTVPQGRLPSQNRIAIGIADHLTGVVDSKGAIECAQGRPAPMAGDFCGELLGWGIDAEATRQATSGDVRRYPSLWRVKAREEGRERLSRPSRRAQTTASRVRAVEAWRHIALAVSASGDERDQALASGILRFVKEMPSAQRQLTPAQSAPSRLRDVGPAR